MSGYQIFFLLLWIYHRDRDPYFEAKATLTKKEYTCITEPSSFLRPPMLTNWWKNSAFEYRYLGKTKTCCWLKWGSQKIVLACWDIHDQLFLPKWNIKILYNVFCEIPWWNITWYHGNSISTEIFTRIPNGKEEIQETNIERMPNGCGTGNTSENNAIKILN